MWVEVPGTRNPETQAFLSSHWLYFHLQGGAQGAGGWPGLHDLDYTNQRRGGPRQAVAPNHYFHLLEEVQDAGGTRAWMWRKHYTRDRGTGRRGHAGVGAQARCEASQGAERAGMGGGGRNAGVGGAGARGDAAGGRACRAQGMGAKVWGAGDKAQKRAWGHGCG